MKHKDARISQRQWMTESDASRLSQRKKNAKSINLLLDFTALKWIPQT